VAVEGMMTTYTGRPEPDEEPIEESIEDEVAESEDAPTTTHTEIAEGDDVFEN
jgi:hypothetical protein